jgi:hypothetical protein
LALGLLFAGLLWACATLFLLGDLGKWADDYAFCMRDPATGSYARLTPSNSRFFRPLSRKLVALHTLLWFHDRSKHVICGASHALTVLLLWYLLRALGFRSGIAVGTSLLFLVYPAPYEVVFWVSALGYGLATSLFLVLSLLVLRLAGRASSSIFGLVGLAGLAFAIVCLNEQPAAGMAALPLLALCGSGAAQPLRRRVIAACRIGGSCALAVAVYVFLYVSTVGPTERGMPATLTTLADAPSRATQLAGQIGRGLLSAEFTRGALRAGVAELAAHPIRALLWIGLLSVVGGVWLILGREAGRSRTDHLIRTDDLPAPERAAPGYAFLFGTSLFLVAWIPVFVVRDQGVFSRLLYFPAIGLAVVAASLVEGLARRIERSWLPGRWWRSTLVVPLGAALMAGAVSMVGVQGLFHRRAVIDADQARQLLALVPDPAPDSIFVSLSPLRSAAQTGFSAFDDALAGPLEYPWAATHFVRWTYRRRDLFAAWQNRFEPSNVHGADADGLYFFRLTYLYPLTVPYRALEGELHLLPWKEVIPFVTEPDGQVRLVTDLVLRDPDGSERRFVPPQALRAASAGHLPAHAYTIALRSGA